MCSSNQIPDFSIVNQIIVFNRQFHSFHSQQNSTRYFRLSVNRSHFFWSPSKRMRRWMIHLFVNVWIGFFVLFCFIFWRNEKPCSNEWKFDSGLIWKAVYDASICYSDILVVVGWHLMWYVCIYRWMDAGNGLQNVCVCFVFCSVQFSSIFMNGQMEMNFL